MDPGSIGGYLIGHIDNCHHCTSSKDKWCTIHHTCRTTNSALNLQWVWNSFTTTTINRCIMKLIASMSNFYLKKPTAMQRYRVWVYDAHGIKYTDKYFFSLLWKIMQTWIQLVHTNWRFSNEFNLQCKEIWKCNILDSLPVFALYWILSVKTLNPKCSWLFAKARATIYFTKCETRSLSYLKRRIGSK